MSRIPGPTSVWPPRRIGIGAAAAAAVSVGQPRIVDLRRRRGDRTRSGPRRAARPPRRAPSRWASRTRRVDDGRVAELGQPVARARPGRRRPAPSRGPTAVVAGSSAEAGILERQRAATPRSPRSSTSARTRHRACALQPAQRWPPTPARRRPARRAGRRAIARTASTTGAEACGCRPEPLGQRDPRGPVRAACPTRIASSGESRSIASRHRRRRSAHPERRRPRPASAGGRCRSGTRPGSRSRTALAAGETATTSAE